MDRKKRNILNNIGYKEYKNRNEAFKKVGELKRKYGICFYLKRVDKIPFNKVGKNRIKTFYPVVYTIC